MTALQSELDKFADIQATLLSYQQKISAMSQQLDRINAEIYQRVAELNQLKETVKSFSSNKLCNENIEQKLVETLS